MNKELARQKATEVLSLINVGDNSQEVINERIENSIRYLSGIDRELAKVFVGTLRMEETMRENQLVRIKMAADFAKSLSEA